MKTSQDNAFPRAARRILLQRLAVFSLMAVLLPGFIHGSESFAASLPDWSAGDAWRIQAVYRQPDGGWSPVTEWFFEVTTADKTEVRIAVRGPGGARSELLFETATGQLRRILLIDEFRGVEVRRDIRIDGTAPVYPLVSPVPYFFPLLDADSSRGMHRLRRLLNGNPLPVEELEQSVDVFGGRALLARLPAEAGPEIQSLIEPTEEGFVYRIAKTSGPVFAQYWDMKRRVPWALYTESPSCKAWLTR